MGESPRGFESLRLRQKYGNDSGDSHIFLFMGIERDSRDELPFKKSIDNAFQGRDEQTHKWAFAVTECKENRTLHEKSRLREQNALPYGGWITVKLTAKDDVDNVGAGRVTR